MNTFGNKIKITIFGASHEPYIGLTVDSFPEGIKLDLALIQERLKQRIGLNRLTSKRFEDDQFEIISGFFKGYTTGAPLTFLVLNKDVCSQDYEQNYQVARPGHSDLTYFKKFKGYNDYRGGGTSSGRLTVVLIILGAICEQVLMKEEIIVASRFKSIYHLEDSDPIVDDELLNDFKSQLFPVYDEDIKEKMLSLIQEIKESQNSIGAVIQTFVKNLPFGLGNPFFDSFESTISHLAFSIPGVKGIEFGSGFQMAKMLGSDANDQIQYADHKVVYKTNHNGGINGGITNSDIVYFQTAFKPTPSIHQVQDSINFIKETNQKLVIAGRHDVIIAIKGLHVMNAITNYAILDMLLGN